MEYDAQLGVEAFPGQYQVRSCIDRRKCPTPIISRFTFYGGRRKSIRRGDDKRTDIYVDLYSLRLMVAVVSLLLLSCLDAFLTLELINRGSVVEANPVMAYLLTFGATPFALVKFVVTACSLIVLCVMKNVKMARICLPCALKIYMLVVLYEVYLYVQ